MKSEEVIYQNVYVSPRPPPTFSYKDNLTCDLDSDTARSSNDIQRIELQPIPNYLVQGRSVCGHESTKRCVLTPRHVENDQTGTGKPVTVDQKEEHKIDFRVPGLSHSVVKEAEHLRVQELVKKIETHPHREALQADLQQNDVYNPFSKDSKAMIREVGNVKFFRVVRNCTKSTVFSLSSLMESRNCVLHLRTMLDLKRIQKKFQ